jgi:hypothetical protein
VIPSSSHGDQNSMKLKMLTLLHEIHFVFKALTRTIMVSNFKELIFMQPKSFETQTKTLQNIFNENS